MSVPSARLTDIAGVIPTCRIERLSGLERVFVVTLQDAVAADETRHARR